MKQNMFSTLRFACLRVSLTYSEYEDNGNHSPQKAFLRMCMRCFEGRSNPYHPSSRVPLPLVCKSTHICFFSLCYSIPLNAGLHLGKSNSILWHMSVHPPKILIKFKIAQDLLKQDTWLFSKALDQLELIHQANCQCHTLRVPQKAKSSLGDDDLILSSFLFLKQRKRDKKKTLSPGWEVNLQL